MPSTNSEPRVRDMRTGIVHGIRAYCRLSGRKSWVRRALLVAALAGALPSHAHANDLNRGTGENVNMQGTRQVGAAPQQSAADRALQQTTSAERALEQIGGAPPQATLVEGSFAGRATYLFTRLIHEEDEGKRGEALTNLLSVIRMADGYNNPQFFTEFMGILPPEYESVVKAALGRNVRQFTAQQFGTMLDHIESVIAGRVGEDTLRRNFGSDFVDAVKNAKEALNVDLFRMLLSFDANQLLADNFEEENWLAGTFGAHGITETPETGEMGIQDAFDSFIRWLDTIKGSQEGILGAIEAAYGVDLSRVDETERDAMATRMRKLAEAVCHLARYQAPLDENGERTVSYDKFLGNLANVRNMMRGDLQAISAAVDEQQLRGRIEAAMANNDYSDEVYGLMADFIADFGIIGTRFVGSSESLRGEIADAIGMSSEESRMSGTDFLFAAYSRIADKAGFFRDRQRIVSQLNAVGITVLEELPETEEQMAGMEPLVEEVTPEYGRGSQLFESLDLLGQYALVKNNEDVFRFLERGGIPAEAAPSEEELRDAQISEAEYSAAYIERLRMMGTMVSPGSTFFLFHTAIPKLAEYSSDYTEFNRLLQALATGVDHITRPQSPYQVYGSQNALSAYLHLQVPKALRASEEGGRGMIETLAGEVAQYRESEDYRLPPNIGVEPVLPRAGPIEPYRARIRNYLDWGMGESSRRFENLPLEFIASTFPTRMDITRRFRSLSAMIPASLGLGTSTDNTAAALYALIASIRPQALYSQSELTAFMTHEYVNILRFFTPPEGLRVVYHAGGRATYYRPIDLYSRVSHVDLDVPPLVPAWVWSPARGTAEAGGRVRGRAGETVAEEVSGAVALRAEAEAPTVGGAGAAEVGFEEEGTAATAGAEFHGPGLGASTMVQGIWYDEETDATALMRLDGVGEDHDYAVLFDYMGKTEEEGEEGHIVRASTYMRISGHWVRAGYYDVIGNPDALRRFADGFISSIGEIGMLGYKYDATAEPSSGQITTAFSITDPESFAGVGFSLNISDTVALVGRYASIGESHLAAGGIGFLLGNGWSLGLVGRGAVLVDDSEDHFGVVAMVDYNKNDTRFTASLAYDQNPVTYYMYNANRPEEVERGELSLVSFPGHYVSGTAAYRTSLSEAEELELWLKTHCEVTEGETWGISAGGIYSDGARDLEVRATGSYEQWLRQRAGEAEEEIDWTAGGGLEISWTTEAGTKVAIQAGMDYSTEMLIDGRRVRFDQAPVLSRMFGHWEAFLQAKEDMEAAQAAADADAEYNAAVRASNALNNLGYALKALARIREISSGGLDSLREATDLMGAANILIESSTLMVSGRAAVVRGAPGLAGEEEIGGGAGLGVRFEAGESTITISGDLGQAPSGAMIGDLYFGLRTEEGTEFGAAYARSVWEEHGLKAFLEVPVGGRDTVGFQGSYLWGGVHGLEGMGSFGLSVTHGGEIDITAAVSGGWLGFTREEEERRAEMDAWQVAAMMNFEKAAWSAGFGVNIIGNLGGRAYEEGVITAERDIMGGGFFLRGSYRDLGNYFEALEGTFETQFIDGEYYITFKAGLRF